MKLHIQLIPISSTDQPPPSPDPPEHVYHYTTGTRLKQIINSGRILPTAAKIEPHEKPVAWFSTQDQWEPTATKVPIPGMAGQIATAKAQGGLVRITVPGTCAPYIFPQLPLIAGTKPSVCIGLLIAGLELGSDPDTWRFTPEPVPVSFFREVEFYDFANNRWQGLDLAKCARRN